MGDEIRVKISDELDGILQKVSEEIGSKKTEYVKSLVIEDLRCRGIPDESLIDT
ncbi:MAG: hypothetical protein KKG60_03730 [Nanoarchaeota archaeon]|nr:hypothetical protein [Nanoarchaeota archaeon]